MTDINALILESLSDLLLEDLTNSSNAAVLQNNYQKPTYPINYSYPTYNNYYNYYDPNKKEEDEDDKPKGGILGALAFAALGTGAGIGAHKLATAHAPKAAYYGLKGKFSGNLIDKATNYTKAAKHAIQSPMIRKMALNKMKNKLFG